MAVLVATVALVATELFALERRRAGIGWSPSLVDGSTQGLMAGSPARWLVAGLSALTLGIGVVAAFRGSDAPRPLPPVGMAPQTAVDARAAATSMARSLAEGNPEVVQHLLFTVERQTGCRARAQSHVVDTTDPSAVAEERTARAERLTALRADPAVQSASHGSARLPDSTSVYHVIVAVVCEGG